ncbi:MAG: hypothetical protein KGI08_08410 [Thaumarchaeota archaeon]|nr:hypothetical protein [Nitrososphaerota archaeon]
MSRTPTKIVVKCPECKNIFKTGRDIDETAQCHCGERFSVKENLIKA